MSPRPLPKRLSPVKDELLSGWLARMARANHCCEKEFVSYLGIEASKLPEAAEDLKGADIDRFCILTQLNAKDLFGMCLTQMEIYPVEFISRSNFQYCPNCVRKTPELVLRHWRYAWSLNCNTCRSELLPIGYNYKNVEAVSARLRTRATEGARRLECIHRWENSRKAKRVDLIMQVARVLDARFRYGTLFLTHPHDRYALLASVERGLSRPLLFAALIVRSDLSAEKQFRQAFPYRKKAVEKILRVASQLDKLLPIKMDKKPRRFNNYYNGYSRSESSYLRHSKSAIELLGPKACKHKLFDFALKLLEQEKFESEN